MISAYRAFIRARINAIPYPLNSDERWDEIIGILRDCVYEDARRHPDAYGQAFEQSGIAIDNALNAINAIFGERYYATPAVSPETRVRLSVCILRTYTQRCAITGNFTPDEFEHFVRGFTGEPFLDFLNAYETK